MLTKNWIGFVRRHHRLFTVFGASVVFLTFMVREGLRESARDQLDEVVNAKSDFMLRLEHVRLMHRLDDLEMQTADIVRGNRPSQTQGETAFAAARQRAEQDVQAAGLSPEQQVESAMNTADRLMGKNWNADERERYRQGLLYAAAGITAKEKYFPQIVTTKDPSGQEHYYRVPQTPDAEPEEIDFSGQKMVPKTVRTKRGTTRPASCGVTRQR